MKDSKRVYKILVFQLKIMIYSVCMINVYDLHVEP